MFEAARTYIKTKLLAGKDPSPSGSVMQHPVYVTVTGQPVLRRRARGRSAAGEDGDEGGDVVGIASGDRHGVAPNPK